MNFTETSDRQLWIMERTDWTHPVWATQGRLDDGTVVWHVRQALVTTPKLIAQEVRATLTNNSVSTDPFLLLIPEAVWLELGKPVHGTTPAFWAKYPSIDRKKGKVVAVTLKEQQEAEDAVSDEAFLIAAWKRSGLADLKVFRLVWISICQEMPGWLVGDMKPIRFGWMTLHAFPYRANWKQVALNRFPNAAARLSLAEGESPRDKLNSTELPGLLMNTVMAGLAGSGAGKKPFVTWTAEVVPTVAWDKFTREHEAQKSDELTRIQYTNRWASILNKQLLSITEAFMAFVRKTTLPAGALGGDPDQGGHRLVPYLPPKGVRPVLVDHEPVDAVTSSKIELSDDTGRRHLVGTNAGVQKVPVLRKVPAYLRSAGGGSAAFRWDGNDADRMLVLDPDRCEGRKEIMLEAEPGGQRGVEEVGGQLETTSNSGPT